MKEACGALLDFFKTEEFRKATDGLSPEATNAFMAGMGFAGVIMMSKCVKYAIDIPEQEEVKE